MVEFGLEIFTFSTTLGLAFPGDDLLLFYVGFCLIASWILAGTFSLIVTAFLISFVGVLASALDLVPLNSFLSTTVLDVLKDFDKDFEFYADLVADLEAELFDLGTVGVGFFLGGGLWDNVFLLTFLTASLWSCFCSLLVDTGTL